jgi:hypothetical protein
MSEIRLLAPGGEPLTRAELAAALGRDDDGLDAVLLQLENAGMIVTAPQAGPVQIITITTGGGGQARPAPPPPPPPTQSEWI